MKNRLKTRPNRFGGVSSWIAVLDKARSAI
jgi:hypothetical protein